MTETVWIAMLGVNPSSANQAVYGDTKGAYFWVAGRANSEDDFRLLIGTEMSRRGLSLAEVSDVMRGVDAIRERQGAEIDWKQMIDRAKASPGLVLGDDFFIYPEGSE